MVLQKRYDYCIVGGGPAGLTLAWILAKNLGKTCLIVEREQTLGGCHRVRRSFSEGGNSRSFNGGGNSRNNDGGGKGLFVEHGPRIYIDNAFSFKQILEEIGTSFGDIFVPYNHSFANATSSSLMPKLSWRELAILVWAHSKLLLVDNVGRDETLKDFLDYHNFSFEAKDEIDRLCRLSDGAGIERYTVFEFTQLINQNVFYSIYEPKVPNDIGLIKIWEEALLRTGKVDIWKDAEMLNLSSPSVDKSKVQYATVFQDGVVKNVVANRYVLAIPPENIVKVLSNSRATQIKNVFGDLGGLRRWSSETRYLDYIPIVLHWDKEQITDKRWTEPLGDWKIGIIEMSEYMDFPNPKSKTVFSTVISDLNTKSRISGKTANGSSKDELKREVLRIVKERFGIKDDPYQVIVSEGVYREGKGKWKNRDTAFMLTTHGYLGANPTETGAENLYNLGTHNGRSAYHFTAIESAVSNAFVLANELEPSLSGYNVRGPVSLMGTLRYVIVSLLLLVLTFHLLR